MGTFLFQFVMGCRHRNHSRPFTLYNETYKVCLDCGGVIHYSLERMEPLRGREQRRLREAKMNRVQANKSPAMARYVAAGERL
jgi:hypothetical protein